MEPWTVNSWDILGQFSVGYTLTVQCWIYLDNSVLDILGQFSVGYTWTQRIIQKETNDIVA